MTLLFFDTNILLDFYRQVGRESETSHRIRAPTPWRTKVHTDLRTEAVTK